MKILSHRDLEKNPISLKEFEECASFIGGYLPSSPELTWPLLSDRFNCEIFTKHENHLPTGSFKVRGGVWTLGKLQEEGFNGNIIAATRGNHGQSIAYAARAFGSKAIVVVPHGNNLDKNQSMRALGAEVIEHGEDFDAALAYARTMSEKKNLEFLPSYHPTLVTGVGTYAFEFLTAVSALEIAYVPIGLGSGIAGFLAAKEVLGHCVEVIGVVSEKADAYASSWEAGKRICTQDANTIADGLAVREPSVEALSYISRRVSRIIRVSEADIVQATKVLLSDTHNLVEPAGAASLAGLMKEQSEMIGRKVGVVLTGSNIDQITLKKIISYGRP
tara:strand:+ start:59 stop:1054 length:996 start_codon:yes stop_codon:yes gene_type:complete